LLDNNQKNKCNNNNKQTNKQTTNNKVCYKQQTTNNQTKTPNPKFQILLSLWILAVLMILNMIVDSVGFVCFGVFAQ
jgi:hypothetical protein